MEKGEKETLVRINDAEEEVEIGTRHKRFKSRLKKLGVELRDDQAGYCWYQVPKSWIRIVPPRKVTENQKIAARKNILKARNSRDNIRPANGSSKNPPAGICAPESSED